MQGRDNAAAWLEPAIISIQEQKYAVYRAYLRFRKAVGSVYTDCLKWYFSISFSEEMVGLVDFLFVLRSFLGVGHSKNI